jgi:hypothetical protein
MLYLQGEKVCICGLAEVLSKSQTRLGPQIANPQSVSFAEGPQNEQIICDLRKFFANRPLLVFIDCDSVNNFSASQ